MRRVNLVLASAQRHTSSGLEAAVLDVCFDQAIVNTIRTARVDELIRVGLLDHMDLIVMVADHLLAQPSRRSATVGTAEVVRAVQLIREQRSTPILAVTTSPECEQPLLAAGVDHVSVGLLLDTEEIKSELRRMLQLAEPLESMPVTRRSWVDVLRGYSAKLTHAVPYGSSGRFGGGE